MIKIRRVTEEDLVLNNLVNKFLRLNNDVSFKKVYKVSSLENNKLIFEDNTITYMANLIQQNAEILDTEDCEELKNQIERLQIDKYRLEGQVKLLRDILEHRRDNDYDY